jgi:hypothetical protein
MMSTEMSTEINHLVVSHGDNGHLNGDAVTVLFHLFCESQYIYIYIYIYDYYIEDKLDNICLTNRVASFKDDPYY